MSTGIVGADGVARRTGRRRKICWVRHKRLGPTGLQALAGEPPLAPDLVITVFGTSIEPFLEGLEVHADGFGRDALGDCLVKRLGR